MRKLGFKTQLLLTLSVVTLLCVGSASYLSYKHEKDVLFDTIYEATKEHIHLEGNKVEQFLADKAMAVSRIADDYKLNQYQDNHAERMRLGALAANVSNLMIGFQNGDAYASYDYPGWVGHKNPSSYDPRDKPWYRKGMQTPDNVFFTSLYHDATTHELMISIGKNIGNGVVIADIPLTVLNKIVSKVNIEGFSAVIVEQDNVVLASSSSIVEVGKNISSYDALLTVAGYESIIDALKDSKTKGATVFEYNLQGIDKIMFSEKIKYDGGHWHLLIGLDKEIVFSRLSASKKDAIIFMITSLFFSVIIIVSVFNILYRPILELKNTIIGLAEGTGHVTQRVNVTSSDDLGQIARGVNMFIDKIQDLLQQKQSGEGTVKSTSEDANGSLMLWKDAFAKYHNTVEEEDKLKEELKLDSLTKLPTRSYFEVLLANSIKSVYQDKKDLLLFTVHIGNYEITTENSVYEIVQSAILELSELIGSLLSEHFILSRTSPSEFSVIYLDADISYIESIVQPISANLRNVKMGELLFHCKVGATYLKHTERKPSVSGMLHQVSSALYSVDRGSDENYAIYQKKQDEAKLQRKELISEFRLALKREELELYLQPQVELSSGNICGAEALLRWNHPQKGFLTPDKFIHVLDDELLGIQLGEWVISSALKMLATRTDNLSISVNITPLHLQKDDFYVRLEEILSSFSSTVSGRLKIELTETSSISDHARVETSMRKCHQLDVRFSLDDFGTGYSTLNQLRSLPASELKIDRSFIQNFDKNKDDEKMVNTMIMLARSFDINIVAEGVESIEQESLLKALGCSVAQGYYYSKPIPYSEFNKWLECRD
ncbi:EAL domain-containing protein [Vibrio sp. JC009]|uniref:EAL domain-containing protein n=1 Tax=Vibrio sp. JC009 TaxID=2912314 RepID=UPI0023B18CF1|nr:EAL domain-containing protein [Vibrio sp. JC009]WED24038.1 EAL domain-containing protein [Vibrio sp. JC009]